MVGRIATYHFPPTKGSRQNLLDEGIADDRIWVTGNTVIDALLMVRDRLQFRSKAHWIDCFGQSLYSSVTDAARRMVLITGHRRENFGQGFIDLCSAIRDIAKNHPDWDLVYPVHLNPNVQKPVFDILDGHDNIHLVEPQDYESFVWLMNQSDIILTDSGGIQEEAPSLGKPVLVMRDVTERPEAVESGAVMLVGAHREKIVSSIEKVLLDVDTYKAMSNAHNPYGDGKASLKIASVISRNVNSVVSLD